MVGARLHVGVLLGGTSSEHDVSVNSGLNVVDGLLERGHRVDPIYLDPAGGWYFGHWPSAPSLEADPSGDRVAPPASLAGEAEPEGRVLERLRGSEFDAIFIALHGPGGEDGAMQGLLRLAGVPFTGSDVLASALAMDKERAKALLATVAMPMAEHRTLEAGAGPDALAAALDRLGVPCVIKPVIGGSSFGTRVVTDREQAAQALEAALEIGGRVLVERHVGGTEVTCGVLGGGPHEPVEPLPLTEIVPPPDAFFDFRAKYTVGACEEITPARVSESVAAEVQRLAVLAHVTLGCAGMSRSDFIVAAGTPVYLETNTVPGMTRTSLLPQGAAAAGISFGELVERLVASAIRRGTPRG